ncbi:peptidoglycan-binding protein [Cellulomonas sp. P22]|uniref:peptidoglycan-binding protein n=1 Tax=Cellulomonas sp. P22 TaxID=3373189 RepID=UPI0037C0504C
MSARTTRPSRLRRSTIAAGILAAALTAGTVAPATAVPVPRTVTVSPSARTTDTDPTIQGMAIPGESVDLHVGSTAYTSVADGDGFWQWSGSSYEDGSYDWDASVDGASFASGAFTVDATAPVLSIVTAPVAISTSANVTFGWESTDSDTDVSYTWSLDGEPAGWGTATTASFSGLATGAHTFRLTAVDSLGNSTSTTTAFEVTAVAPSIAWASTPPASTTSTNAHFAVTVPAGAQVEYLLDLPEGAQNSSPIAVTGTSFDLTALSIGHHKIQVGATLNGAHSEILVFEWDVTATAAPAAAAPVLSSGAIPAATINRGIRSGARGASVSIIQSVVGTPADGRFGAKTTAAVRAFQRAHGLYADGIVGPLTWAAIVDVANGGSGFAPLTASSVPAAQIARGIRTGSSASAIAVVQRALGAPVTSRFDATTRTAVTSFQASHGLTVDGIVGPKTWAALVAAR